jgi:Fur family iron response transcriptional regulator
MPACCARSASTARKPISTPTVSTHHHFYLEHNHELVDIPDPNLVLSKMPDVPEGYEISRVDMVVRLRKKR